MRAPHSLASRVVTCTLAVLLACGSAAAQRPACADCDGDGAVTILDALAAMRVAAGLLVSTPALRARCDVHPTTGVTALDGLLIAQAEVGLVVIARCGPPQCSISSPSGGTQLGDIVIAYELFQAEGLPADVSADFSTDGGASFLPATMGQGGDGDSALTTSGLGQPHDFVWDSAADLPGPAVQAGVVFALTPSSADGSSTCTTTFDVSNPGVSLAVASIEPASGSARGGQAVIILGTGFAASALPRIDGVTCFNINVVSPTTILATTPPALPGRTALGLDVTVDSGGPAATLPQAYTYDADTTAPFVLAQIPARGSSGNPNNTRLTVIFSEPIDPATVVFNCTGGANVFSFFSPPAFLDPCTSTYTWAETGDRFTFDRIPDPAGAGTQFTNVNSGGPPNVADLHGNTFNPTPFGGSFYQSSFGTTGAVDNTPPAVAASSPAAGATGVAVDLPEVIVDFDTVMDPATLGAGNFEVRVGGVPIAGRRSFDLSGTTARFVPQVALVAGTEHEIMITGATSLRGTALPALSASFTTAAADMMPPTIDSLTIDDVPAATNGTGPAGGTLQAPPVSFTIEVSYSDLGGSGIDPTSLSVTAGLPLGGGAPVGFDALESFGGLFTTTYFSGSVQVSASIMTRDLTFPAGAHTLRATIRDNAGNVSAEATFGFTVTAATSANRPFEQTGRWQLRFDQDFVTPTYVDACAPMCRYLNGFSSSPNGVADWLDDLVTFGFRIAGAPAITPTGGMTTAEAADAEIRRRLVEALHIEHDIPIVGGVPTPGPDSIDVSFSEAPPVAPFSVMDIGGSVTPFPGTYGLAFFDHRNGSFTNLNVRSAGLGVFPGNHHRGDSNPCAGSVRWSQIFDPINPVCGTPVGADPSDPTVLDPTFDRSDPGNSAAENARYDIVFAAIEDFARSVAAVANHEIGHSQGLAGNGAPPAGLFGGDPLFGGSSGHLNLAGTTEFSAPGVENIMRAATLYDSRVDSRSGFARLIKAYYRERLLENP